MEKNSIEYDLNFILDSIINIHNGTASVYTLFFFGGNGCIYDKSYLHEIIDTLVLDGYVKEFMNSGQFDVTLKGRMWNSSGGYKVIKEGITNDKSKKEFEIRKIKIHKDFIPNIIKGLEIYFSNEDIIIFKQLLQGERLEAQIVFRGNQNRFSEVFRRLNYNAKLIESYAFITNWICKNFTYQKDKEIDPRGFSPITVYDLIARGKGEPTIKSLIHIEGLEYKPPLINMKRANS